jgi:hypothetical protein
LAANDRNPDVKRHWVERVLWSSALAGLILLAASLAQPSEPGNAWLGGYSKARVLLAAVMLGGVGICLGAAVSARTGVRWFDGGLLRLEQFLSASDENLLSLSLTLGAGFLLLSGAILLSMVPLGGDWGALPVVLQRIRALMLWGVLVQVQAILVLFFSFRPRFVRKGFWAPAVLGRFLLVCCLLGLTLFHWVVLFFQLSVYTSLDGWFFYFRPRSEHQHEWLFLFLLAGSLGLAFLVTRRVRGWPALALLMTGGYLLQIGFMWMEWGDLMRMSDKYLVRYAAYAEAINTAPPPLDLVREYQTLYGGNIYTGTKAPGFMLVYWLAQRLADALQPVLPPAEQVPPLNMVVTLIFPALATLVLLPLTALAQDLLGADKRVIPSLLYFSFPGVLLISLFLDQVLYPLAFVLLTWLAIRLAEQGNIWQALALGALLYLALFLAFALLPAVVLVFLLLGLHFLLFGRTRTAFWRILSLAGGLAVGFLAVYLFFSSVLGYDALARYLQALETHRLAKSYPTGLATLPATVLLNSLDFALGAGFPTFLLLAVLAVRSLHNVFRRQVQRVDWVMLAFAGMLVGLNIAGQTRSETARLWLFLLPLTAVFATDFFSRWFGRNWLYWLIIIQLLTTFFVFRFQRLY